MLNFGISFTANIIALCIFQQQIHASPDVEIRWPVDEAACSQDVFSVRDIDSVRVVPAHCLPYMKRKAADYSQGTFSVIDSGRLGAEVQSSGAGKETAF